MPIWLSFFFLRSNWFSSGSSHSLPNQYVGLKALLHVLINEERERERKDDASISLYSPSWIAHRLASFLVSLFFFFLSTLFDLEVSTTVVLCISFIFQDKSYFDNYFLAIILFWLWFLNLFLHFIDMARVKKKKNYASHEINPYTINSNAKREKVSFVPSQRTNFVLFFYLILDTIHHASK